ncbi:putative disulfide isomerase [Xylona heveae TC161]|uniref:Putative disulfide isomerase n=1 Tax=Xylona heveae (strain CBS 132557 / TC161) TaxID=1328760 RepID=A0A165ISI3_XYLHT|nr:putative disulfide isomerase [Xylona heveae TC161]KZF25322.1 putative disulfide isomerase [Xylona heveae TC161]
MRFLLPVSLVSLLLSPVIAAPPPEYTPEATGAAATGSSLNSQSIRGEDSEGAGTVFNGVNVPPMKEINGAKFDEEIKDGYWLVDHYSPYCHHCQALAPIYQTLYEFYYTSNPVPSAPEPAGSSSLNSFRRYYKFNFGKLDCVAYGDTCEKNDVNAWPTLSMFKDGKLLKAFTGVKDLESLSAFVEETLESIRPGSRPKEGLLLPEVGASHAPKQAKPKRTPNPAGQSVPLNAESFQSLVTTTQDPWFVKFYAPWCHHCQAMAPTWAELGIQMKEKLNIGEVNCDEQSRLCKDAKISGFPTLLFFRGGERIEYEGLRGLGDLQSFSSKALAIGEGVRHVNAAEFEELEKQEEVIFVYFYDHATTSEDFEALERLTLSLIGHAKLVKTDDQLLVNRFRISTWPRLLVSRQGRPTYYNALSPRDMRDFRKVLDWMQSVWLPIVPELTASNAREIMDGRLVVLGVLSRERSGEFTAAKREMTNAALEWMDKQTQAYQLEKQELRDAKQLRIEEAEDRNDQRGLRAAKSIRINMDDFERKEVGFAWVDGVFWDRWVRTTYGIDVKNGERVIINDEDNRRFWDQTITGNYIVPSRTSILETLPKVVASPPKLTPKSTAGKIETVFYSGRRLSYEHPFLALGLLIGFVCGLSLWGRRRIRRARGHGGGFFHLDGREGLLGVGGNNGKVD